MTYHNAAKPRFCLVVLSFVREQKALSGTLVFRKWFTSCYMQINQKTSCRQIPHTVAAFPHMHCPTELTPWATICLSTLPTSVRRREFTWHLRNEVGWFLQENFYMFFMAKRRQCALPEKEIVQYIGCYVKLHCISGHCKLFLTVSLSLSSTI